MMRWNHRSVRDALHRVILVHATHFKTATSLIIGRPQTVNDPSPANKLPGDSSIDLARTFHRGMAAIIDAVQTGIWEAGVHDLLGYATDYAFGQQRGMQTLVLKSKHRSAYVRLSWDTIMDDGSAARQLVDDAIKAAINELR